MTEPNTKRRLAKLQTEKAKADKQPSHHHEADVRLMASVSDVLRRGGAQRGRALMPPRLMQRNGTIYIVHGSRRHSTGFEAYPGMDIREHAGARQMLKDYVEGLARLVLKFK
jgi:hypothetical protein